MNEQHQQKVKTPAQLLNEDEMKPRQWLIVAVCVLMMALDGYDVMSISLAGPGIRDEWNLSPEQLGFILPLEFIGMAIGSIFIGSMSDNYGRRITIVLCLLIITLGMAISGLAGGVWVLAASRVFTGLGIGGILAGGTALTSEYSNKTNRSVTVVIIGAGYTFGIFLASKFAGPILIDHDWRLIFQLGAVLSLIFIPAFWFLVPESIAFLERKRTVNSQADIEKTLKWLGHNGKFKLPEEGNHIVETSFGELFKGNTTRVTVIMMVCYVGHILTYYFYIKWMPSAVTELGFTKAQGTEVLAAISLAGIAGSVSMAVVSRFFALKPAMIVALLGSALSVAVFPLASSSFDFMLAIGAIGGFAMLAGIGGMFALMANYFPPAVLGTGTGLVAGAGRGGAVLGPWVGGLLFGAGFALMWVSPVMALGSAIAGISILFLPKD